MRLSLIVAASERGVIGDKGKMPWKLPDDLRTFKKLTMGHPLIMGRKTFESIGRPLPGRTTIMLSRQLGQPLGVVLASSLDQALATAVTHYDDEVFICGGAEVYRSSFDLVSRIYLTRVYGEISGDTTVPELDGGVPAGFVEVGDCQPLSVEGATHKATLRVYDRKHT